MEPTFNPVGFTSYLKEILGEPDLNKKWSSRELEQLIKQNMQLISSQFDKGNENMMGLLQKLSNRLITEYKTDKTAQQLSHDLNNLVTHFYPSIEEFLTDLSKKELTYWTPSQMLGLLEANREEILKNTSAKMHQALQEIGAKMNDAKLSAFIDTFVALPLHVDDVESLFEPILDEEEEKESPPPSPHETTTMGEKLAKLVSDFVRLWPGSKKSPPDTPKKD